MALTLGRKSIEVARLLNAYHCEACDVSWVDEWCCACDDECPDCGDAISPEESKELETFTLQIDVDVCDVCGSTHAF